MSINEPEAAAVRSAYRELLAGATLVAITNRVNAAGHVTTRGNPWQRSMVRALLLNSRYAAIRTYRGTEVGPGTWPAIVPEETWRAAVTLMADPARRLNKGTARRWLGAGLYLCGRCGSDMRINYRDEKVRVYRCRASAHLSRGADRVDEVVESVIVARLRLPDLAEVLAPDDSDTAALREQAATLRDSLDRLGLDYAEGLLTGRQVKVATTRIEDQLALVERDLLASSRSSSLGGLLASPDPGEAWLHLDLDARRAVLDLLAVVTVMPGRPGRAPFDPSTIRVEWRRP